jgi:6-phosphogluconolactonase
MALNLTEFESREAASEAASRLIVQALKADLAASGAASLMVSGGGTPKRLFGLLSHADLDWPRVTVGLVDDRWVAPDHPDSNEKLVRTLLLQDKAARANFLPMKTKDARPFEAEMNRNAAYAPHCCAASFVLLGMGEDGHTASWFAGMDGLADVVSPEQQRCVAAVEALQAIQPLRMTLTGSAVYAAKQGLLLVFGEEKRSMLLVAPEADPMTCPVRFAIDGLGRKLSVYWAP